MGAVKRAGRAIEILPDDPNSHYFHAFNLGRHSQSISIVEALKQGTGGKIQASLKRTLELAPDHAEAHTAMGMYHAEIVAKVGRLVGGMTYGASSGAALEHFEKALELTPEAPIAHIEYGTCCSASGGSTRSRTCTSGPRKCGRATPWKGWISRRRWRNWSRPFQAVSPPRGLASRITSALRGCGRPVSGSIRPRYNNFSNSGLNLAMMAWGRATRRRSLISPNSTWSA